METKYNYVTILNPQLLEALIYVHFNHNYTLPLILLVISKACKDGEIDYCQMPLYGNSVKVGIMSFFPLDINEHAIKDAIREAVSRNIIINHREHGIPNRYTLNADYTEWIYDSKMEGSDRYEPMSVMDGMLVKKAIKPILRKKGAVKRLYVEIDAAKMSKVEQVCASKYLTKQIVIDNAIDLFLSSINEEKRRI